MNDQTSNKSIEKYQECADCHNAEGKIKVYEFDDEDGKAVMMCESCYGEHEQKGDWCS